MNSTPAPGRQRLRPADRTDAILAAAIDAFAAAPYDQVSMAAVGRACGASEALVFKYFESKAGLYAAVVRTELQDLARRQDAAIAALPANSSARDLVRVLIEATLDQMAAAENPAGSPFFSAQVDPPEVEQLRAGYRSDLTATLLGRLRNPDWQRGRIGVIGFLGFLGAAAAQWVAAGCPPEQRGPLVDAALGALQGAIGDWDSLAPPGR
jgi:AcrR family transcriptional regulator